MQELGVYNTAKIGRHSVCLTSVVQREPNGVNVVRSLFCCPT